MIEIRELVIKAKVTSEAPAGNGTQTEVGAGTGTQGIVNLCVAEVLKILKREKER